MNDDRIETMLTDAGSRMRATAPDPTDARAVLRAARAPSRPPGDHRRRGLALAGIGLAAAGLIGVIAYSIADDDGETVRLMPADPPTTSPAGPEPDTIAEPVEAPETTVATPDPRPVEVGSGVVSGCVDVRAPDLGSSASFCIDELNPLRQYLVSLQGSDEVYELTAIDGAPGLGPVVGASPIGADSGLECGVDLSDGVVYEVIDCRRADGVTVAIAARLPDSPGEKETFIQWRGTTDRRIDLEPATATEGLAGVDAFFTDVQAGPTCLTLVSDGGDWREYCADLAPAPVEATTILNGQVHQLTIGDGTVVAHALDRVWPSSGCSLAATGAIMTETFEWVNDALVFDGTRCVDKDEQPEGDTNVGAVAGLSAGGVFLTLGPPDGLLVELDRTDGMWSVVDFGTGIDVPQHAIPPFDVWTTWPGHTAPVDQSPFGLQTVVPAEPASDQAVLERRVVAAIEARFTGIEPDAGIVTSAVDRLVIATFDGGPTDAIERFVLFVWFDESEQGLAVGDVYGTFICTEPEHVPPLDSDLCV